MNTPTSFQALRAISALVLKRMAKPVIILGSIVLIACILITAFLALSFSNWWWLLLLLFLPLAILFSLIVYVLSFFVQQLLPRKLSKDEEKKLHQFTEKIFGLVENTRTPYPILLMLVGKDVIRGRESTFISGVIDNTKSAKNDFDDIKRLFQ
jgi:ABC-type multidrug transport system fused ATPase/permease subunit